MRCPRCDALVLDNAVRCNFCGQDLSVIHYLKSVSGAYYNIGLERAGVRNLSGAVEALKKSLEYFKGNTMARNLLGLVYYEMGETAAALSEWVLSKYLVPDDNLADYFLDTVRSNQAALDIANQAIKKYNAALASAQARNDDLAIIQLKKVVGSSPHFLRAAHLLALLYMKNGELGRAYKVLQRVKKIDVNNTVTLRYLEELGGVMVEGDFVDVTKKPRSKKDPLENVTPVGRYREEKRSLMPFIYIVIGLAIGILVCFVLIRPTLQKGTQTTGSDIAEVSDQLSVKDTQIASLESKNEELEEQIKKLNETIKGANTKALQQAENYKKLVEAASLYLANDKLGAVAALYDCKKKDFEDETAQKLYESISQIPDNEIKTYVEKAKETMNSSTKEALKQLKAINKAAPNRQDVLYLIARCYHYMGKKDKAKKYYEKAIAIKAGTEEAVQADRYLTELSGGKPATKQDDDNDGETQDTGNADNNDNNTGEN
ncbi:MAG: tetratricopeptide repeat protein [Eubacterium sp.]|nr:tetratricopeptide repeat protein [Eubacterium sp.]